MMYVFPSLLVSSSRREKQPKESAAVSRKKRARSSVFVFGQSNDLLRGALFP
jgi:hypothetical protein